MIRFVIVIAISFIGMELISYLIHRFIYHKILWAIHKSHHSPRTGPFELNDVFPLIFAALSVVLMALGLRQEGASDLLATSIGIMAYGSIYFIVHDLYVHRRVKAIRLRIPLLLPLKKAHAIHHRYGEEPYGLLFFVHPRRVAQETVGDDDAV